MPKNKYDYCSECKVKLKRVKQRRTDYKKCAECRGDDIKGASELRAIFKSFEKNPTQRSIFIQQRLRFTKGGADLSFVSHRTA